MKWFCVRWSGLDVLEQYKMDKNEIQKIEKDIQNKWLLIGSFIQRKACEKLALDSSADAVPLLINAFNHGGGKIKAIAEAALRALKDRDAIDVLCNAAIQDPEGSIANICLQTKKRPSSPEQACLFLFVTRQLEEYFKEDDDFQYLRDAYERADPKVKEHVISVVRSGDRRCQGFFGGRRKKLQDCTPEEIRVAIDSALRHKDWSRLFRAFRELPLKHGFPLLVHLRTSAWEPAEEDMKGLLHQALVESKGESLPKKRQDVSSSLFERWLSPEGRPTGSEGELLEKLKTCAPPDGVRIVGALAALSSLSPSTAGVIAQNAHWLVRMAGFVTGITATGDINATSSNDTNYWVTEIANVEGILEFWPASATPNDLEKLEASPREAWAGKLGTFRKLLRLLIAQRMDHPGEITPVEFEAGEFAGTFIEAE